MTRLNASSDNSVFTRTANLNKAPNGDTFRLNEGGDLINFDKYRQFHQKHKRLSKGNIQ